MNFFCCGLVLIIFLIRFPMYFVCTTHSGKHGNFITTQKLFSRHDRGFILTERSDCPGLYDSGRLNIDRIITQWINEWIEGWMAIEQVPKKRNVVRVENHQANLESEHVLTLVNSAASSHDMVRPLLDTSHLSTSTYFSLESSRIDRDPPTRWEKATRNQINSQSNLEESLVLVCSSFDLVRVSFDRMRIHHQ